MIYITFLLIGWYVFVAGLLFKTWLSYATMDKTIGPNQQFATWVMLFIATAFWGISLPLTYLELLKKRSSPPSENQIRNLVSDHSATLEITQEQLDQIHQHASLDYPQECCGLLVGKMMDDRIKRTIEVHPMRNTWTESVLEQTDLKHSKGDRFWIDPAVMLQVMKQSRAKGLEIIGVYHSHPDHPAIPSECDRQMAWPHYSYLIVSVAPEGAIETSCWHLDAEHYFQPEMLRLSSLQDSIDFLVLKN